MPHSKRKVRVRKLREGESAVIGNTPDGILDLEKVTVPVKQIAKFRRTRKPSRKF